MKDLLDNVTDRLTGLTITRNQLYFDMRARQTTLDIVETSIAELELVKKHINETYFVNGVERVEEDGRTGDHGDAAADTSGDTPPDNRTGGTDASGPTGSGEAVPCSSDRAGGAGGSAARTGAKPATAGAGKHVRVTKKGGANG